MNALLWSLYVIMHSISPDADPLLSNEAQKLNKAFLWFVESQHLSLSCGV